MLEWQYEGQKRKKKKNKRNAAEVGNVVADGCTGTNKILGELVKQFENITKLVSQTPKGHLSAQHESHPKPLNLMEDEVKELEGDPDEPWWDEDVEKSPRAETTTKELKGEAKDLLKGLHKEEMEDEMSIELRIFITLIPILLIITPTPSTTHFIPTKLGDPDSPLIP